jgi:tRNA G18 (ribose-2'-O)-methylase SpoU
MRGYYGIGIENVKTAENVGTLWRSAYILGASFIFTIGKRYKKQASDTTKSWKHIPLYNYESFELFYESMPYNCRLVGVEINDKSIPIREYKHPERCIYLLGAEDSGLSKVATDRCHELIVLPGNLCLNVAVAGSLVLYDRIIKYDEKKTTTTD